MTLTDEQKAIAKIQAQGCRRWMSLIILAPVLICVILTILAPSISDMLAKREANQQCQNLPSQTTLVTNSTLYTDDTFTSQTVISADNLEALSLLGETVLDTAIASRDRSTAIAHPSNDYTIYTVFIPDDTMNFFICDSDTALGAFSADGSAGDVVFNTDGSLFAVADGDNSRVLVFDGVDIARRETLTLDDSSDNQTVDSIAFHPTEPLLFFTADNELFVYETVNFRQLLRLPISETNQHEIGFNAEATLFYLIRTGDTAQARVWAIGE